MLGFAVLSSGALPRLWRLYAFCPVGAISEVPHEIGVVEEGEAEGIRFVDGVLTIGQPMAPPIIRQVKHTQVQTA